MAAVEALVGQRLGTTAVPEVLTRLVEEKAEGNPLFTEELALALRDAGLVRVVDGRVELLSDVPDVLARRLPLTVHGAITSRIDRLSPTQQLTVKVASVIGRVFAVGILRDIHPLRQAVALTLTADLTEIERADLTVLDTPEPDLSYLFKHVIVQEAAYNLMLLSQRRQLHRSAAEWYERAGGGDLALLAHHWRLAEVPAKAVHYLERAGTEALREGAYAEAVRFFTALLEVDDGDPSGAGRRAARAGPAPRPSAGPAGSTSSATPTWASASSRPSRSTCTPPWPCWGAGPRPAAAGSRASWPGRPASSCATGSGRGPWSPARARPGPPSRRRPRSTSACSWSTTTPASGPRRCTRRSRA